MRIRCSALLFFFVVIEAVGQNSAVLRKADSLLAIPRYQEAYELIKVELQSSTGNQRKILLQNKLIEILILQGNLDEAERTISIIPNSDDVLTEAITLTNKGFFYLNKGRFDIASELLQSAQQKFNGNGFQNTREYARCISILGSLYGASRKYNQAEENQLLALQIREKLFGINSEEVAASYNDLGTIYLETNPEKALDYFDKAYATYKNLHGNDHPKIAIVKTNMGFAYRQLELYGDAINDFEEANKTWLKIYPEGHPNQALVLSFLGQTYRQMKDPTTAEEYFSRSLQVYQKSYGNKHPDISKVLIEIGTLQQEAAKYDKALEFIQRSIIANSPRFNDSNAKRNPQADDNYNSFVMLYSLRHKSEALETKYFGKTLKREDLLIALSCLQTCDTLIDKIRYQSSEEADKIALGELANEVYEDGVRIAYLLSEVTLKNKLYKELTFYFSEKSKSAVLQESIADSKAKSFSGIPSVLLDEEKAIKAEITLTNQLLALKPEIEKEKQLREKLFSINTQYNAFIKKLEVEYPNYYNLKFSKSNPSVSKTQSLLNDQSAVISYFIAEKNQRIYQFVLTKNKFHIYNLELPKNFERTLRGFSNSIYFSNFEIYKETNVTLKKTLIPSLPKSINELIIIPSGKLGTIPFEAIAINAKKANDFNTVDYLINHFGTRYEFASSLLSGELKEKEILSAKKIFLCAPVKFSNESNLGELPGTESEITAIASLFGEQSTILKLEDANEKNIKNKPLTDYNFLHFATHGIVDEDNPELSRIFLNKSDPEDGNLYAGEIYNLEMNAELAVLSACQTGLGKVSKGEGVIGLSRALTYAGAKNLIVSFWSVSDESTSQLMTDFYKILITSRSSFSEALQKSKIELIKSKKYSSPYFWAPFVLIGN